VWDAKAPRKGEGMGNETATDQYVRHLIEAIVPSSPIWEQGDGSAELVKALKGGTKQQGNGDGKPEFAFLSNGFLVVVEDKKSHDALVPPPRRRNSTLNLTSTSPRGGTTPPTVRSITPAT